MTRDTFEAKGQGCGACADGCKDRESCRVRDESPPSAPVGVEGLREVYSAVIRALAAIVTTGGSDKIEELGAIPRSPVMDQVAAIRGQMDKLSALAQQPAAVDEAGVRRAVDMLFPALKESERAHISWRLHAALAAQTQGASHDDQ